VIESLYIGLLFGLSAGLAPGPLMTLTVTQTLQHGASEGLKVALAPLVTDIPIILAFLFLLDRVAGFDTILGMIGLFGGCYVIYLGYEAYRIGAPVEQLTAQAPASLRKGILVNALSPHPYLFWATVGGPFVLRAAEKTLGASGLFIAIFYLCLVGAKMALALLVGRYRGLLAGNWYYRVMRTLALLLIVFGLALIRDALALMDLIPA